MIEKSIKVIGIFLILGAFFCNPWLITALFSLDGILSVKTKADILTIEIILVSIGFIILKWRKKSSKKILFNLMTLVFILGSIEVGLQLTMLLKKKLSEEIYDERQKISYYSNKQWGTEYWKEFQLSSSKNYVPFIVWSRKEYSGKWINVDKNGLRKTWNPSDTKEDFKKVYIFGGSTLWGTGARDEFTIPSYFSKLLNYKKKKYFVFNYGETGYTFTQELVQLILLLRDGHRPNYIIFYDGINDVYATYQSGKVANIQNLELISNRLADSRSNPSFFRQLNNLIETLLSKSMTLKSLKLINTIFYSQKENKYSEVAAGYTELQLKLLGEEIVNNYIKSIHILDKLSHIYGFKYLCFWQPVIFTKNRVTDEEASYLRYADKKLTQLFLSVNERFSNISISHFYNISDALRNKAETYYIDFCHLMEGGNEIVANKIYVFFEREYGLNKNTSTFVSSSTNMSID